MDADPRAGGHTWVATTRLSTTTLKTTSGVNNLCAPPPLRVNKLLEFATDSRYGSFSRTAGRCPAKLLDERVLWNSCHGVH